MFDFLHTNPLSRRFREMLQSLSERVVLRDQIDFGPNLIHRNVPGGSLFIDALPRSRPGGGLPPNVLFAVRLFVYAGANGSATSAATYTYSLRSIDTNTLLAVGLTPQTPRAEGKVLTSDYGSAYYDAAGELHLLDAHEVHLTGDCVDA